MAQAARQRDDVTEIEAVRLDTIRHTWRLIPERTRGFQSLQYADVGGWRIFDPTVKPPARPEYLRTYTARRRAAGLCVQCGRSCSTWRCLTCGRLNRARMGIGG